MFCCTLLYVYSSIALILMGKRELIALLNLSSWCLVMVERLFLAVPRGCLQFVIVVFPDDTHLLFFLWCGIYMNLQRYVCFVLDVLHPFKQRHSWGRTKMERKAGRKTRVQVFECNLCTGFFYI